MIIRIKKRWHRDGGYKDILRLSLPLIFSQGSLSIQTVVDRVFLSWYAPEAVAAAMPSGMIQFTISSLFIGAAGYVGTFTAQYFGAGRHDRIGPVVWQGFYLSLAAGLLGLMTLPFSGWLFSRFGHPPDIQSLERTYFNIMMLGLFPAATSSALSAHFSGLGRTWTVLRVTLAATSFNLFFDYVLVFGKWAFPEMGIAGAAWATALSQVLSMVLYASVALRRGDRDRFGFSAGWRPDGRLFLRLARFGFPNGLHFALETSGFTLFLILVGRIGTDALAATNIAFSINHLAFMPMFGFGTAASILVGQRLGRNRPDDAARSVRLIAEMTFAYMASVAAVYFFAPGVFLSLFAAQADPERFAPIAADAARLLKFVAFYSLFDTANIVFASAVKGAGDTRFVMWVSMTLSWALMALPSLAAVLWFDPALETLWAFATLYICVIGIVFTARFMRGKWKTMRVIEPDLVGQEIRIV
ncbi:MAG: MATE family efflux transporter [bacterium]|nr:MATE family efflux transporter [bacterium]